MMSHWPMSLELIKIKTVNDEFFSRTTIDASDLAFIGSTGETEMENAVNRWVERFLCEDKIEVSNARIWIVGTKPAENDAESRYVSGRLVIEVLCEIRFPD